MFSLAPLLLLVISVAGLLGSELTRLCANRCGAKILPNEDAVPAREATPIAPPPDAVPGET